MGDLAEDTRVDGSKGRYRGAIHPWWDGWGPNGGFLSSMALRAVAAESALPRPAGISVHFLNVAEHGEVDLEVTSLRASKRAESLRVTMLQKGKAILEALVRTAWEQEDGPRHDAAPMPPHAEPEEVWAWTPEPGDDAAFPLFLNFEARLHGWPPGQRWEDRKAGEPVRVEWARFRPRAAFEDPYVDAARSLVLVDTLMFSAAAMAYEEPMSFVAPSLDLTMWFHRQAPDEEWLLCEASSPVAEGGLMGGMGRVWARDGRLLATGGQQMLIRSFA